MKTAEKMTRREFMASAGGTAVSIGLPGVFVKLNENDDKSCKGQRNSRLHHF